MRKAVSRSRCASAGAEKSVSSKTSLSGQEGDRGAGAVGGTHRLHLTLRYPAGELLPIERAVAADFGHEPFREGVDDGDPDAVEPTRDLVAVTAELASGMELRQHDGECGKSLLLDQVDRNPTSGVDDSDRVVGMNRDVDEVVPAGERLVDSVVDHFVDEVMQPPGTGRPDVHTGPQPHRFEAFQDRDVLCGVIRLGHAPQITSLSKKSPANRAFRGCSQCIRNGGRKRPSRGSPRPLERSWLAAPRPPSPR